MALLKDGTRIFGTLNVNTEIVVSNTSILSTLNSAFSLANTGNTTAVSAFDKANSANVVASSAFDKANSANVVASSGFDKANIAITIGSSAFDKANSANVVAVAAFDFANTRLSSNGGTIFGSLTVSGNLTISGNTIFNNVSTYSISDPLIYLAANNYTSDLVDIGFIANYVNTTGSNVHTGLMRDSGTKEYYLFHGYDQEPQNNHIDPSGNNFTISFLNAGIRSSNIILNGINVDNWIQSSYNKANSANVIASVAFDKANAANVIAVQSYNQANSAFDKANSANVVASAAFDKANSANVVASSAFDKANSANVVASAAFDKANSANVVASSAFDKANSANVIASAAFDKANSANVVASSAFDQANSASDSAALGQIIASAAFDKANSANVVASSAFDKANSANVVASSAFDKANSANVVASSAFDKANSANVIASAAFDKANSANVVASSAFNKANSANAIASAAFDKANLAAPIASPTFTGTVTVPSSLIVLKSGDPSEGGEINFEKTSGSSISGNLVTDLYNDRFRIFEQTGTNRGFFLDITKGNTGVGGEILHTNNWFNFISTSSGDATAAFNKANAQANLAFSTVVANGTSLVADSNADTLTILTSGNVSITADAAGDNMTFDLTTTGVTAATYGSATIVPVLTVDSRGRLTSVTNTTINTFSFGVVIANGTNLVADTSNDTLTIRTTGNVAITADAAGDNLTFDLTTTGVTAATYGSATIVPVLTVDSRGRLTSVTNTTMNVFAFGIVAANGTNLVADTSNDTLTIRTTGNVSITADAAGDNMTFDLTTTGVTAATYGSATIVPVLAVDSRGRLTSVTNTTINVFAFGMVSANGTNLIAGRSNDILTIRTTGNVAITADAAGDNLTFDLTTTGVTAATYGSATIVPVLTVDARGRLTSVTNTTIDTTISSAAFDKANSANVVAVAAFDFANTRLSANGGTIFGNLIVSGNLTISGNTVFNNVSTYRIDDPLIYLAANNYTADLVDIGFIANYVNTTGSNVHTGLMRDSGSKEYYLFQGYDQEPQNNHIDPSGNNFTISFLNANIRSSNIILNSINVDNWIQSSYNKANSANVIASAAFDKANAQANLSFSTIVANGTSLVADSNADTLTILTTGNVAITADAAGDNMTFDLTTTGVTAATYGSATIVPVLAVDSRGRLTSVTNTSINVFAFGVVAANGTNLVAGKSNDTLTIRTTGNVAITADAAGDNMTFDLTTTGVTAATYGSATVVPVLTVDARGRLTSVSNVAITGSGGSSNSFSTVSANGTSLVATSSTDTLTIRTTGNVAITADAAGDNMTFDLTTTGVTAATYGSDTIVPVLAVDSRGRITSVSNVTISTTGGSSSNSFVYVSDSPPANVANGFLWWQSNTGSLYIRYGDGDSSQWVATQQQGIGGGATFSQPAANAIAQSPTQLLASANGLTYTSSTFATAGDASVKKYMLIGTTTNATPLKLLHGGGSGLIPVGSNTTMQYTIDISARRTDVTGESAGWTLKGVLDSFSGTVADVGNLYEIILARDDTNYAVDALANNTTKSLDVIVTGVNAKTIRWVAFVQTVEVTQ